MADEKQEKPNFHTVIPWPKLEKHLKRVERKIVSQMRTVGGNDLFVLQGKLCLAHDMLNLPEALTVAEEDDPNAGTHTEGKA